MKAAYLLEPGEIEIRDVPTPEPAPGEIVVRIECALTCGTDLKAYRRGHPFISMPGRFGHQYSGRVATVGASVRGFEPGVPIWGVHSAPCLACDRCRKRHHGLCRRLREQLVIGAFAEYLLIPERVVAQNLLVRPTGMTSLIAAFLEPVACVVHALSLIDWRGVERVLVIGLGSMGLLFAQLIQKTKTAAVVALGRGQQRLDFARSCGLQEVIDAGSESRSESASKTFDCVIECTGKQSGWQAAVDSVSPGGHVVFFGGLPKGTTFGIDTYRLHYDEIHLHGCFHFGPGDVRRAAEILSGNGLQVEPLVGATVPLSGLPQALDDMAAGKAVKYALDPWS